MYEIDMEVRERFPDVTRNLMMAYVRDRTRVFEIFETHRPALVFHAAAVKHVPMVEMHHSEGVLTNVHRTRNVADAEVCDAVRCLSAYSIRSFRTLRSSIERPISSDLMTTH